MYGLFNKAVEDLVISRFGSEVWQDVLRRAGVADPSYITTDPYPDHLTFKLIAAASVILESPTGDFLEELGAHWPGFLRREGYAPMLGVLGDDLEQFLENLDDLHARVGLSLKKLRAPTFRCQRRADGNLILHYQSPRRGLGQMVVGLLRGVAKQYGEEISIERLPCDDPTVEDDTFLIRRMARTTGENDAA